MKRLKKYPLSYAAPFWIFNRKKSCEISLLIIIWMTALWTQARAQEHPSRVNLSTAVARVAKQNIPAVVHIEVTERQEMQNPLLPFENDPLFIYRNITSKILRIKHFIHHKLYETFFT